MTGGGYSKGITGRTLVLAKVQEKTNIISYEVFMYFPNPDFWSINILKNSNWLYCIWEDSLFEFSMKVQENLSYCNSEFFPPSLLYSLWCLMHLCLCMRMAGCLDPLAIVVDYSTFFLQYCFASCYSKVWSPRTEVFCFKSLLLFGLFLYWRSRAWQGMA